MMNLLDRMGDLNPQLLRELKGRLSWRSVLAVLAISIVVQALIFLWFYSQLPTPETYRHSWYCAYYKNREFIENCYGYGGSPLPYKSTFTNWLQWWRHVSRTLSIAISFLLIVPSAFFLLSDLQHEGRQGTLDFVRLSPRSASSILVGKMLGVPILVYVAIASLVPFHLFANLKAGEPFSFLLSFYIMIAAGSVLIFSFTLLFGFLTRSVVKRSAQALSLTIVYVLLVSLIYIPGYLIWNTETVWRRFNKFPVWERFTDSGDFWIWFGFPISQNVAIAHLFTLVNIAILCGWIWQSLTRCFHQPNATLLQKRQSYGLIFYLQLLMLGIGINERHHYPSDSASLRHLGVIVLPILLNLPIFLALIVILTPQRQAVMDWARYRRSHSPRSSLLQDLLFHDQSPAGFSIGVNLAIAGVLWLIAFAFGHDWVKGDKQAWIMLVFLSLLSIAVYSSIVQWALIQKTRKSNLMAGALLVMVVLVPPTFALLLSLKGLIATTLTESVILMSPFLWTLAESSFTISLSAWGALLGQLSLIAGINALIARQVRQIGASEMKEAQFGRLKAQS